MLRCFRSPYFEARKPNPNPNFLVRMSSGGVGVFHMKGRGGRKSSVCPSKPGKSNAFGGISRDFAGISRGCPKSLREKRVFVFNPRPLYSLNDLVGPRNSVLSWDFIGLLKRERFGDRYDWTTGVPDSGNEWKKFRVVPRLYPLRSLVL